MARSRNTLVLLAVAAVLPLAGLGCKKEEPVMPTRAPDSSTPAPATQPMSGTVDSAVGGISSATQGASGAAAGAAEEGEGMMAKLKEQAGTYYGEAMKAIEEKDFSKAKAAVDKLDAIKDKLPADWQSKIDTLKTTLAAAETTSGSGLSIPGLGGKKE